MISFYFQEMIVRMLNVFEIYMLYTKKIDIHWHMSIVFISCMARCTYMKTVLKQTFSRLLFACIVKRHIYIVQTLDNDVSRYTLYAWNNKTGWIVRYIELSSILTEKLSLCKLISIKGLPRIKNPNIFHNSTRPHSHLCIANCLKHFI